MELSDANWIDIVVLGLALISTAFGLARGFFGAVWSLLALVCGIIAAKDYGVWLLPLAQSALGDSPLALPLAMISIFIVVYLAFQVVAYLFGSLIDAFNLGGFNRLGGAVFGLARGGLLAAVFVLGLSMVGAPNFAAWEEAQTPPYIGAAILAISEWLPADAAMAWLRFDEANRPSVVMPAAALPDSADVAGILGGAFSGIGGSGSGGVGESAK